MVNCISKHSIGQNIKYNLISKDILNETKKVN